jgi:hypothetical protein
MIAIINKGPVNKNRDAITGWHKYDIYINKQYITSFNHKRIDMLAACLDHAAMAVRKKDYEDFQRVYTAHEKPALKQLKTKN